MSELAPIGDRGQRYEVVQHRLDGTSMVWGWTNTHAGGSLGRMCLLHPSTAMVRVTDRFSGRSVELIDERSPTMGSTETSPHNPPESTATAVQDQQTPKLGPFTVNGPPVRAGAAEFHRIDNLGSGRFGLDMLNNPSILMNTQDFTREQAERMAEQFTKLASEPTT